MAVSGEWVQTSQTNTKPLQVLIFKLPAPFDFHQAKGQRLFAGIGPQPFTGSMIQFQQ
jgi:hypothetical protein